MAASTPAGQDQGSGGHEGQCGRFWNWYGRVELVVEADDAEARGNVDARKRARGTGGGADEIREGGVADREDLRAAWRVGVARQQEAIHPVGTQSRRR